MKRVFITGTVGGHLSELLIIFEDLIKEKSCDFIVLTEKFPRTFPNKIKYFSYFAPRNLYLKIPFSFLKALYIIAVLRPEWVITTGAQVGIGAIFAGKILGRKTMFIETVTRYKNPTRSAKVLYPLVDKFYVQHPEGLKLFGPKAEYIGGIF